MLGNGRSHHQETCLNSLPKKSPVKRPCCAIESSDLFVLTIPAAKRVEIRKLLLFGHSPHFQQFARRARGKCHSPSRVRTRKPTTKCQRIERYHRVISCT